jgi:protoheme ferro-lyase
MIAALKENHGGTEFRVMPALGDEPEIVAAVAAWVMRAAR